MRPKLVIFDLFGTLIFPVFKLKKEEFFSFYQNLGIKLETKKEAKRFRSLFGQLMVRTTNWQDFSQRLLEKMIKKRDQETVDKLAKFYKKNLVYQLYDDVKETIDLPYQKAILTSGSPFLFSNLKLEKQFEVFTPRETKFLKPDKRAFLTVLGKFEVSPKESIMIGDEIERDLIPAKKLGMRAILIDREGKNEDYSDVKIDSLKELKNILGP